MSLLNKLKKFLNDQAADLVSDAVKNAVKDAVGGSTDNTKGSDAEATAAEVVADTGAPYDFGKEYHRIHEEVTAIFDGVMADQFADQQVEKDVPARTLDPNCHPACTPIQYLFYKNGVPSLAVVLVKKNTYNGMNVKGTMYICKAHGIRYIRFYEEMENDPAYIAQRIRQNL